MEAGPGVMLILEDKTPPARRGPGKTASGPGLGVQPRLRGGGVYAQGQCLLSKEEVVEFLEDFQEDFLL